MNAVAGGQIRACTPADMPRVAHLFNAIFRGSSGPAPAPLQQYLSELFCRSPLQDPELPSRVYVRPDGVVGGFLGSIPLRMVCRGRPIRAALASSAMVEHPDQHPLAGARLLRAFLNGPQDLSFSDDANRTSVAMWKKLGAHSVPSESMDWLRVLEPAEFALAMAGERMPLVKALRPACRAIDGLANRWFGHRFELGGEPAARGVDLDLHGEPASRLLRDFAAGYALGPDWDASGLDWLLRQAEQRRRHGPLVCRAVEGHAHRPLGCYLYYGRPHAVAHVLHVMAAPGSAGAVLDDLLDHAHRNHCVAVRGRAHSRFLDDLCARDCVFLNRGSVLVHSRHPEIVETARSGDALMTGLAGEAWTRIAAGDAFDERARGATTAGATVVRRPWFGSWKQDAQSHHQS